MMYFSCASQRKALFQINKKKMDVAEQITLELYSDDGERDRPMDKPAVDFELASTEGDEPPNIQETRIKLLPTVDSQENLLVDSLADLAQSKSLDTNRKSRAEEDTGTIVQMTKRQMQQYMSDLHNCTVQALPERPVTNKTGSRGRPETLYKYKTCYIAANKIVDQALSSPETEQ